MTHYYSETPDTPLEKQTIEHTIQGQTMVFTTANGVFSKSSVDFGSHLLLDTLLESQPLQGHGLDIGCGYGPLGISLATQLEDITLDLIDINERAITLAKENIDRYHLGQRLTAMTHNLTQSPLARRYDFILTNPPIRTGKKNIFTLYEKAFQLLKPEASFYLVIQKKQGAKSTEKKLISLFGNCQRLNRKKGYHIYKSTKK